MIFNNFTFNSNFVNQTVLDYLAPGYARGPRVLYMKHNYLLSNILEFTQKVNDITPVLAKKKRLCFRQDD